MARPAIILSAALMAMICVAAPAWSGQGRLSDPRKPVNVESGGIFVITLESNRTTGYEWQVAGKLDTSIFEVVGVEYVKAASSLAGAGGVENWTFRALSSRGRPVPLRFKYVRPWEKDVPPVKETTFSVIITKGDEERRLDNMQRELDKMHRESFSERINR